MSLALLLSSGTVQAKQNSPLTQLLTKRLNSIKLTVAFHVSLCGILVENRNATTPFVAGK